MPRFLFVCVILLAVLGLVSCSRLQGVSEEIVEAKGTEFRGLSKSRIVSVTDQPYVGARPVTISKNTEFSSGIFARHIILNRQGSLADLCATVSRLTGLPITIDAAVRSAGSGSASGKTAPQESELDAQLAAALGIDGTAAEQETPPEKPREAPQSRLRGGVRIVYEGTVKGLLDTIGARFGLAWEFDSNEGAVVFATTAVRTFTVWATPGQVTYDSNITNASSDSNSGGNSAGGGVSSSETSRQTTQTNTTSLSFDLWKDTEEAVKKLAPTGSVMVNQAAGTITVRDTVTNLNRVEKYIDQLNENLSKQVALSIKVWALELSDTTDIGVSLSMFFESPDVKVFAGSSPISFESQGGDLSAAIVDGKLRDSTALLKALRRVGRATQVTSGGGVIMNNHPMPVQSIKREAYLASASLTTTDTGETATLTPGEITTGFSMTVIPHIREGRRVVLEYAVDLSSKDDLVDFTSGNVTVQQPKTSARSFKNHMTIKMGQTLVLAGFEQEVDAKDTSGGFLGVGRSQGYKKSLIVITISTESGDV
jgi:type IVB pilus formation R64 PilN family outer membrane protein